MGTCIIPFYIQNEYNIPMCNGKIRKVVKDANVMIKVCKRRLNSLF